MNAIEEAPATGDASCLERAQGGEPAAFSTLYRQHIRAVYLYALGMLKDAGDAEDASHDVFVLAWEKRSSIRIVDQSVLPWLLVSTRNICLNRIKKANRERDHRTDYQDVADRADGASASAFAALDAAELQAAITAAVGRLSRVDQKLYSLCIEEGLSYTEAAMVLKTSHATVRTRLSRLRHTLRVALADQKEGLS